MVPLQVVGQLVRAPVTGIAGVAAGDYRVDILVTPNFNSGDLTNVTPAGLITLVGIIDRDVLLACQPAFFVTVE